MKNRLVPIATGSKVTWFKKQTFTIIERHSIPNWPEVNDYLLFHLDVYAYICNARPDKDFEKQGGELIVIVVQRGTIKMEGLFKMSSIHLEMSIDGMTSTLAYPKNVPNNNSDHIYRYTIDFAQSLDMFKDQGNSSFEALIEYQDDLTCYEYKQSVENGNTVQSWAIKTEDTPDGTSFLPDLVPFFGLSVFSSTKNLSALRISHVIKVAHDVFFLPEVERVYSAATEDSKMDLNFIYTPSPSIEV